MTKTTAETAPARHISDLEAFQDFRSSLKRLRVHDRVMAEHCMTPRGDAAMAAFDLELDVFLTAYGVLVERGTIGFCEDMLAEKDARARLDDAARA